MPEEFVLDPDEVAEAGRIIRGTPPGLHTLAKLYGAEWDMKEPDDVWGAVQGVRGRRTAGRYQPASLQDGSERDSAPSS